MLGTRRCLQCFRMLTLTSVFQHDSSRHYSYARHFKRLRLWRTSPFLPNILAFSYVTVRKLRECIVECGKQHIQICVPTRRRHTSTLAEKFSTIPLCEGGRQIRSVSGVLVGHELSLKPRRSAGEALSAIEATCRFPAPGGPNRQRDYVCRLRTESSPVVSYRRVRTHHRQHSALLAGFTVQLTMWESPLTKTKRAPISLESASR